MNNLDTRAFLTMGHTNAYGFSENSDSDLNPLSREGLKTILSNGRDDQNGLLHRDDFAMAPVFAWLAIKDPTIPYTNIYTQCSNLSDNVAICDELLGGAVIAAEDVDQDCPQYESAVYSAICRNLAMSHFKYDWESIIANNLSTIPTSDDVKLFLWHTVGLIGDLSMGMLNNGAWQYVISDAGFHIIIPAIGKLDVVKKHVSHTLRYSVKETVDGGSFRYNHLACIRYLDTVVPVINTPAIFDFYLGG